MARGVSPITWSNVAAPTGGAALSAFNQAGQNLGNAISGVGDSLKTGAQDYADSQTADFLNDLNAERDPAVRQQMIDASSAFLDNQQVNAAQDKNRIEDRTATTFANAQTAFGQGQADRKLKLARDTVVQGHEDQDQVNQNSSATIEYETAFEKLLKERSIENEYQQEFGNPKLVKPAYSREEHAQRFGPSPSTQGSSVQAAVAALQPEQSQALVAPASASVASTSLDAAQRAVPPEFSPEQQAAIDSGFITPEQVRINTGINSGNTDNLDDAIARTAALNPEQNADGSLVTDGASNAANIAASPYTPETYDEYVQSRESAGGTILKSLTEGSSASGKYGIVNRTATGLMKNNPGLTFEEAKGKKGFDLLTEEHRTSLSRYGLQDDMTAIYTMHGLGGPNGEKLFKALLVDNNEHLDVSTLDFIDAKKVIESNTQWFPDGAKTSIGQAAALLAGKPDPYAPLADIAATKTSVAEAKQLIKPTGAKYLNSDLIKFKDSRRQNGQATKVADAKREWGEYALQKAGYTSDANMTANQIYKMKKDAVATLTNSAGPLAAQEIVFATMQSKSMTAPKTAEAARKATEEQAGRRISEMFIGGDGTDAMNFDVKKMAKKYGAKGEPLDVRPLALARNTFAMPGIVNDIVAKMRRAVGDNTPFTKISPVDGSEIITEVKGVAEHTRLFDKAKSKFPNMTEPQWKAIEEGVNAKIGVKASLEQLAIKKTQVKNNIKYQAAHRTKLIAGQKKLSEENTLDKLHLALGGKEGLAGFSGIARSKVKESVDTMLKDKDLPPEARKHPWLIRMAIARVGEVEHDIFSKNSVQTKDAGWWFAQDQDKTSFVNKVRVALNQVMRENGGTGDQQQIAENGLHLNGSVYDIPPAPKDTKQS